MKILSKELYRLLREALAPELKAAKFKRLTGGMLGWTKQRSCGHLSFWFQCDRYGWFEQLGSSFTLEFQVSADAAAASGSFRDRMRFFELLSADEREFVQRTNNEIKRNLPQPASGSVVYMLPPEAQKWLMSSYEPVYEPYSPHQDVWLHYAREEHVATWGAFFRHRIVRMADDFEMKMQENSRRASS